MSATGNQRRPAEVHFEGRSRVAPVTLTPTVAWVQTIPAVQWSWSEARSVGRRLFSSVNSGYSSKNDAPG